MPVFRRIRISEPARRDLKQLGDYTQREWGAAQKRKYLGQIKDGFRALRDTPGMGAPRDEIATGLRAHPVRRHVIFYRDSEGELLIVRVLHERMDLPVHLAPGQDRGQGPTG